MIKKLVDSIFLLTIDKNHPFLLFIIGIVNYHRCKAFICDDCINTGEPAAVFGYLPEIKVVEVILPKSIAAGLLFCWSLVIGHWSLVIGEW